MWLEYLKPTMIEYDGILMVVNYMVKMSNTVTYFFFQLSFINIWVPFYTNRKFSRTNSSQSSALNNTALSVSYLGVQQLSVIQHSTNSDVCLLQAVGFEASTRSICNNYASATISLYLRRTQKTRCTSFQLNPIRLPTMYL